MSTEGRLISLDAFRGATIAGMILVNNPGSWENSYAQLRHAAWNGWTLTDWIFPFFLWIVGVAMTFSFARRMEKGKGTVLGHSVRRALILFGLGIVVNGFPFGLFGQDFSWESLRIPGVLQRIAICYLIGSIVLLYTGQRAQVFLSAGLLALYVVIVKCVPVPGYGAGVLEPMGSIEWYLDSSLLHGHTWVFAPVRGIDPEGILSTIPAIATLLTGIFAGHFLRSGRPATEKTVWMFVAGYALMALSAFCDMILPINKNLWTSSYVLLTTGAALVTFGLFYWLIDVQGWRRWPRPFVIFGMNAIVAFMISELLATLLWVIAWSRPEGGQVTLHDAIYGLFIPVGNLHIASLLFAIAFVAFMYLIAYILWRGKIFLKV